MARITMTENNIEIIGPLKITINDMQYHLIVSESVDLGVLALNKGCPYLYEFSFSRVGATNTTHVTSFFDAKTAPMKTDKITLSPSIKIAIEKFQAFLDIREDLMREFNNNNYSLSKHRG